MHYTTCAPRRTNRRRNFNKSYFKSTNPSANIIKNEDGFEINLAIPGFSKKDIAIELNENRLTIKSNLESEKADVNFQLREFDYQSFSRSFSLSKDLNQDKIEANMEKGILKINIPYLPVIPAKQISIK